MNLEDDNRKSRKNIDFIKEGIIEISLYKDLFDLLKFSSDLKKLFKIKLTTSENEIEAEEGIIEPKISNLTKSSHKVNFN